MNPVSDPAILSASNPFSSTAIASVTDSDVDPYTLQTDATRTALQCLDTYLQSEPGAPNDLNVIAIVGEYGTGKTHIVDTLLRHARLTSPDTFGMYVDAPLATFLDLYRERFITKLDPFDVWARVEECYADVVADFLSGPELSEKVAYGLRARAVDPRRAVEIFGLPENLFQEGLRAKLREVTRTDDFATVLSLAVDPHFYDAVWGWLCGREPDEVLRDRGVSTKIGSEALALEAIGVFALLYGSQNHKFILVIDELEKVLAHRPLDEAGVAFQKLLTVFRKSGGFLILSGLPDFRDALPASARERIDRVVNTAPLTEEEARNLIVGLQELASGEPTLSPFRDDIVRYLVKLCGGVVRKIIRLCHSAYNLASERGGDVTVSMVEEAAGEPYGRLEDTHYAIRRLLDAHLGLQHVTRHMLVGEAEASRADFWIRVGDTGAGCALVIAEAVLTEGDVDELAERASAIREAASHCEVLVLVAGFLAANLTDSLQRAFDAEPMVYEDTPRFTENFLLWINESIKRVTTSARVETMRLIHDRVDLISSRQTATQGFLEQLAVHLDSLRATSDRQLSAIYRMLQELAEPLGTELADRAGTGSRQAPRLPDDVASNFDRAFAALDDIRRIDMELSEVFAGDSEMTMLASGRRGLLRSRFGSRDLIESAGIAALLQRLLEAFRDGVWRWLEELTGRHPGPRDDTRLRRMCETFETLFDALPTYRLDPLVDLSGITAEREDAVTYSAVASRRADFREAFDGFAGRVYRTTRDSAKLAVTR